MSHVPTPDITPRTGLWGLGFRMEIIANRFSSLYDDIHEVWLLGKWLAWPFYFLAIYFYVARDKCWQADQELVFVITWVKGLVEGNTIVDILEQLWGEFTFLRYDPIGWVRAKIDQVSGELRFLREDPYGWIRSRLYLALPVFYNLLGNSGWWIYSKLDERYPQVGEFIRDPWDFIRSKVLGIFSWARSLQMDPGGFIVWWLNAWCGWFWYFLVDPWGFIRDRIRDISFDLGQLIDNSRQWFKDKLASILGMYPHELDNFIPSLIKRAFSAVLNNQEGLLDYAKESMVNLILRFI